MTNAADNIVLAIVCAMERLERAPPILGFAFARAAFIPREPATGLILNSNAAKDSSGLALLLAFSSYDEPSNKKTHININAVLFMTILQK
jgi:hypothetical protein